MSIEIQKYKDVNNTLANMYMLVNEFKNDARLKVFEKWPLQKIYDYISKTIPYVPDPVPGQVAYLRGDALEQLKSPVQTMHNGGDCDDKSILAACIFELKKIPYRFAVVSTQPDKNLHHVYLEIYYQNKWRPFDATYPSYKLFFENPFTKKKIFYISNGMLYSLEVKPNYTKCRSCKSQCAAKSFLKNYYKSALLGSNGHTHTLNGPGVQLAILRGADKSLNTSCNCGGPCCSGKTLSIKRSSARDRRVIKQGRQMLLGNALNNTLGVEPVTTVTTVLTVVSALFGGLFKKEAYQDAYNAWSQALQSQNEAGEAWTSSNHTNQNALAQLAVSRAIIAVLSKDYMNPPLGADVCTSAGRCGNRAEWLKIQPEVEAKAAAVAPFFAWIEKEIIAGRQPQDAGLETMVNWYSDFKSKGALYSQYTAAQKKGSMKSGTGSGLKFSGTGLLLAAAAVGIAYKIKSKKHR